MDHHHPIYIAELVLWWWGDQYSSRSIMVLEENEVKAMYMYFVYNLLFSVFENVICQYYLLYLLLRLLLKDLVFIVHPQNIK